MLNLGSIAPMKKI